MTTDRQKRSVPPYPDPKDTDQRRVNRQIVENIKYLRSLFVGSRIEQRIDEVEKKVQNHDDIING